MENITEVLSTEVLDNSVQAWLIALLAACVSLTCFYLFKVFGVSRLTALARQTRGEWDDALADLLARTSGLFLLLAALFVGSLFLTLPATARQGVFTVATIALLVQGGLWLNGLLQFWLTRDARRRRETDPASITTINAVGFVGRLVLWVVVLLLVLDNLGVDVTALIAGLGIGGIAVALAVQNIFGDLFASLSIVLDKPFTVGDFLIIDDFLGSVEYVGLKTTRIRSLSGEQLIFSNADLLGSRIRNYGRMFERRVVFALGVTYQTPRDKLARIPGIIRESIEEQDKVRFDRSHFKAYGDFSLNFETVYYVLAPDYNLYMDIQQAINLRIHERFEQEGIEFAYPTQTLFINAES
ncbi:MAG: mechanosensitive ion channel family protein [Gammaproteobacteria bacterium]|jgi:small-conductance mechanosensitive channel